MSDEIFASVCVVVDKKEKLPETEIVSQLNELRLTSDTIDKIMRAMSSRSMGDLVALLGAQSEAIHDLESLFRLAEGYQIENWLSLDASVVRGLAYYTGSVTPSSLSLFNRVSLPVGIVFEAFDRSGTLRAICGGGRYDKLLSTLGGENQPCAGFGFGDAVIMELLKDKNLLPTLPHQASHSFPSSCSTAVSQVDDFVFVLDEELRPIGCRVALGLRRQGRRVDLGLDARRIKWAFKVPSTRSPLFSTASFLSSTWTGLVPKE